MKHSVYLAGPITGLNFKGATDWRQYAQAELRGHQIDAYSPMRGKAFLEAAGTLSGTGEEYAHLNVLAQQRSITTRDRFDATRCSVLLVNLLGATRVSIGTVMEIAWADLKRTPIVCAIEPEGNCHEHMMLREVIGFRVPTLDEALAVVKSILA
jgi:hypothetical protein